jgi:L-alanine-DL-glutamate epimerase-like enolase superfamily enzyme
MSFCRPKADHRREPMSSQVFVSNSTAIEELEVSAYRVPTDFPESDGTLCWDHTTIVVAEVAAGEVRGIGYTYADTSTAQLIKSLLAEVVCGRDAMDVTGAWRAMLCAIRNLGRPGIASMAIAAVDSALWDLKAKLLGLPLAKVLGMVRDGVSVYGSGGFTSYPVEQLQTQLHHCIETGIRQVKMKVGRNPGEDPQRVRAAREAIGNHAELFVDANGAYDRKQALRLAEKFAECEVSWFEEPVSSDDLEGLCFLRAATPAGMEIAAGEYGYDSFYFRRMLEAGAVDVLQADASRCGGITGFLKVSALCEAHSVPLSATAPFRVLPRPCSNRTDAI